MESHELLPSGKWEGFYCFQNSPKQHKMAIELLFKNGKVNGSGIDDVAPFKWSGNYSLENFKIQLVKTYSSHSISYFGDIDENGIWGIWENTDAIHKFNQKFSGELAKKAMQVFGSKMKGGFHIWPKKKNTEKQKSTFEEITESLKLKEIYIEIIS